ncbi:hypothetical protein BGZ70_007804 [Mortierella alpina]|uniref:Uncharacterized protein n=1 Tax=Mortierella alpina TaxID=64518 RepID=A0A9P6M1M7_MORAP|nr:hypothetical protein BGZ70_007804 [Mortierella alpina]
MSSNAFIRPSFSAFARIQQSIDQGDTHSLLATISDPQWLDDAEIHALLWHHPETLSRLLDVQDEYIQFASYRLIEAMLQRSTEPGNDPGILRQHQQRDLIKELFRKLTSSARSTSSQERRAILELFHKLLKNQRHLPLQAVDDSHFAVHDDDHDDIHVASALVRQLEVPLFWKEAFGDLFADAETQHATLVLLIDIEKARLTVQGSAGLQNAITVCHKHVLDCSKQICKDSGIQPFCIRKLYELLCLLLKRNPRQGMEDTDVKAHLELALQTLTGLSPLALQTLTTLMEVDPHLESLSNAGTTFILPSSATYNDVGKDVQCLLDHPEAIRQMGRVFITGGQAILDALLATYRDTNPNSSTHTGGPSLALEFRMTEWLQHSLRFVRTWIGPRSLELLLRMYGEDDAGIGWLLKAMSTIQHRLEELAAVLSPNSLVDELYDHLFTYVHPLDALFLFLESIGYDDQTLIDMLITIDDHDTGGMLAALMAILRSLTEQRPDQLQRLVQRWRRELEQAMALDDGGIDDDSDDDADPAGSPARMALLCHSQRCLVQLASQIQLLDKRGLFPYNPRTLVIVLARTQDVLSSIISEVTA